MVNYFRLVIFEKTLFILKRYFSSICVLFCSSFLFNVNGQPTANIISDDPHYESIWFDDFSSPNTTIGGTSGNRFIYGDNNLFYVIGHNENPRNEPQVFLEEHVELNNEGLLITGAKPLSPFYCTNCSLFSEHEYSAGKIRSSYSGDRLIDYGYVEAKIKISSEFGMWPAFWLWNAYDICVDFDLLGNCVEENQVGEELDLFEMLPGAVKDFFGNDYSYNDHPFSGISHDHNIMTSNLHNNNYDVEDNSLEPDFFESFRVNFIDDYRDWHVYSAEIHPDKIIRYLDGVVIGIDENPWLQNVPKIVLFNIALNPWVSYDPNALNDGVYMHPEHPDRTEPYDYYPGTDFENVEMQVEYFKYFKLNMDDCNQIFVASNQNSFDSYNNRIKSQIIISNAVFNPTNSPTIMRASSYIHISSNFTADEDFFLDVSQCY